MRALICFLYVSTASAYLLPPTGSSRPAARRSTGPRLDAASDEAESKQIKAERLRLQAERAELQAEVLALQGEKMRLNSKPAAPAAPAAPLEPGIDGLCRELASRYGTAYGGLEALQQAASAAWTVARREQRDDVVALEAKLGRADALRAAEKPAGELSFGDKAARAVLVAEETERTRKEAPAGLLGELWALSERSASGDEERRARARSICRKTFAYLRGLQADGEEPAESLVPVPGEGLVSVEAGRAALRRLKRHEAAGAVEYRIFAEVLSRDESLAVALGLDEPVGEDDSSQAVTTLVSRFLFRSDKSSYDEAVEQARVEPPPLFESEEQARERVRSLEIFNEAASGTSGTALELWLSLLSELLAKSALVRDGWMSSSSSAELDLALEEQEEASLEAMITTPLSSISFPVLLTTLCARQGAFGAIPVFVAARMLASLNAKAIATHEGFDAPLNADTAVSELEGSLMQRDVKQALGASGAALFFASSLFLVLGLVIAWQLGSLALGLFLPGATPLDPLDF